MSINFSSGMSAMSYNAGVAMENGASQKLGMIQNPEGDLAGIANQEMNLDMQQDINEVTHLAAKTAAESAKEHEKEEIQKQFNLFG